MAYVRNSGQLIIEGSWKLHCNFNPLDKWAEEIAENRKLYERLLQAEKEKMELLKQLLEKMK